MMRMRCVRGFVVGLMAAVAVAQQDPAARIAALAALAKQEATAAIVEQAALALGDVDAGVRKAAVDALLVLRPDLAPLRARLLRIVGIRAEASAQVFVCGVPLLAHFDRGPWVEKLRSPDAKVRIEGIEFLCAQGVAADAVVDDLLACFGDAITDVRAAVARGIATLSWTDPVRDALLHALGDAEAAMREAAAETLTGHSQDAKIVEAVRAVIQDPAPRVRAQALRALGASGETGKPAAAEIVAMVRDRDDDVRAAALDAVAAQRLDDPRAVRATMRCLGDGKEQVLFAALRAIAAQGPQAAVAWPQAMALTRAASPLVRSAAVTSLWAVTTDTQRGAAILRLVETLLDTIPAPGDTAERLLTAYVDRNP